VNRKRTLGGAALIVTLVCAGVAYAAASPNAKLQKQDRLYGGGAFSAGCFSDSSICFALGRNFAVDAHADQNGHGARGNSNYGAPGGTDNVRTVTCLRVVGNRAAIGGIIVSGGDAGWWFVQYFVDRGGPAQGDRDLSSPSFVDPPGSSEWPAGFPYVCPSPATGFPGAGPIFREVESGYIVVRDAPEI
jgi:hypothetical protein